MTKVCKRKRNKFLSLVQYKIFSLISIMNAYSNLWTLAWHQQNWHTPPITFHIWWHIYFTLMRWGFSNFLCNHPQLSVYLPLNCEQASHIFRCLKMAGRAFWCSVPVSQYCFLANPPSLCCPYEWTSGFWKVYHIIDICLKCCSQRSFILMSMPLWEQGCRIPPSPGTYLEVNVLFSMISP